MGKAQDAFINMLREMGAQVIDMSDPKAKSEARNKNDQKVDYEELFVHLGLTLAERKQVEEATVKAIYHCDLGPGLLAGIECLGGRDAKEVTKIAFVATYTDFYHTPVWGLSHSFAKHAKQKANKEEEHPAEHVKVRTVLSEGERKEYVDAVGREYFVSGEYPDKVFGKDPAKGPAPALNVTLEVVQSFN